MVAVVDHVVREEMHRTVDRPTDAAAAFERRLQHLQHRSALGHERAYGAGLRHFVPIQLRRHGDFRRGPAQVHQRAVVHVGHDRGDRAHLGRRWLGAPDVRVESLDEVRVHPRAGRVSAE